MAVAGCGDAKPSTMVEPGVPAEATTGASTPVQAAPRGDGGWFLDSLDGGPIIEESAITLRIDENLLNGFDGCNSYGGRSEDGTLIAGADGEFSILQFDVTDMGCPEPEGVMEQADAYISALIQGESYRVVDDRLELFDSEGTARLVFVRQAPPPGSPTNLEGTAWRLLIEGDADGDMPAPTMVFLNDRLVTGATACRPYAAIYRLSEGSVRFPSTSMLRHEQLCPEESRRLEGEYTDFLTWAREYSVYEEGASSRLEIRNSRGEELTFEPLPPSIEDIADIEWTLGTFIKLRQGDGVPPHRPVIEGTEVTISFDEDGFSGSSGCNSYLASARIDDGSIAIDALPLIHTKKACEGMYGLVEQEERYLGLLPRLARYDIYGDSLFVQTDNDVFLLFQAK